MTEAELTGPHEETAHLANLGKTETELTTQLSGTLREIAGPSPEAEVIIEPLGSLPDPADTLCLSGHELVAECL